MFCSIVVYWPSRVQYVIYKLYHILPLTGFWWRESTKLRGFSMVYFRSRIVCEPPPSDHWPFLAALAWSSKSHSLAWSGLKHTESPVNIKLQTKEFTKGVRRAKNKARSFYPSFLSSPDFNALSNRCRGLSRRAAPFWGAFLISSSNEFVHYQKPTHVSINSSVVLKAIIIFKGN